MLLYIHIPFCDSKCGYCAFYSITNQSFQESYINALCKDLESNLKDKNFTLDSIFFGGGTPNVLDSKNYEKIFSVIYKYATLEKNCEISIECNVNVLESSWCKSLASMGANRFSIGVQSVENKKLAFLGRKHTKKDIAKAFEMPLNAGVENVSCDFIYDTPLDSKISLENEILMLCKLPIKHISAYSLSIDENSAFAKNKAILEQMNLLKGDGFGLFVRDFLKQQGFFQYEVSNFAKNTKFICKHNLGYWQGREYIGCGASSVGRVDSKRLSASSDIKAYIANPTHRNIELLSESNLCLESIMLGLRTCYGVEIKYLQGLKNLESKLKNLLESKKIIIKNGFVIATELFLADEIVLYLWR